jgi:hypothetical protein
MDYWVADATVIQAVNGNAATVDYTFSGVDQATIAKTIVDTWQALPYGNDGIVTSNITPTGVTRQLTLISLDGKTISSILTTMGARANGYDMSVDPVTRQLILWSPRRGNDLTASTFLDSRSIGEPTISWTVAPGVLGSEVFVSGGSTLGATITSTASNATLRSTFGRSYVTRSYTGTAVQSQLDDTAARVAADMSTQLFTIAPKLLPVPGFGYGDFNVGDQVTYDFDAGLGRQTFTVRISSISTTLDTGREILTVGML